MKNDSYVYVTYIRTTPEKLWQALTEPEFTRQYWTGVDVKGAWQPGGAWSMQPKGGEVLVRGEVVESTPPKRLVMTWLKDNNPELQAEGATRLTYELEPVREGVKLTVIHECPAPGSKMLVAVSKGWPLVLASLKSLLETGQALPGTGEYKPC